MVAPEQLPEILAMLRGESAPETTPAPTQQQEVSSSKFADQSSKAPSNGYDEDTASSDLYSGHDFGGRTDWVDVETEENEDAWQLTGR